MSPHRRRKLIALDDDGRTLREIAHAAGMLFDVRMTSDPRQALAWLDIDASVGVFVTEQVLRTAAGISLLETVRTQRPDVRRVLVTGYADLPSIIGGLHSGAIQAMVSKPIVPRELHAAILPPGEQRQFALRATG